MTHIRTRAYFLLAPSVGNSRRKPEPVALPVRVRDWLNSCGPPIGAPPASLDPLRIGEVVLRSSICMSAALLSLRACSLVPKYEMVVLLRQQPSPTGLKLSA